MFRGVSLLFFFFGGGEVVRMLCLVEVLRAVFLETSARKWQEPANAEINAVNQHKKPKEALLFDKLSEIFVGFVWMCTVLKIISTEWHFTYMSPILFWVLDLRTWLSLLVTLIVAAIKIQSKNSPRPWDFQSQLFGEAFCRHVGMWVM